MIDHFPTVNVSAVDTQTPPITPTVPNLFPKVNFNGIAIIGEAPGEDEIKFRIPFYGRSGQLLDQLLSAHRINRSACFIGNVSQHRPPNNDIKLFRWDGVQIQEGLRHLRANILQLRPRIIIPMGNYALRAVTGLDGIGSYRGSPLFTNQYELPDTVVIPTYHPAFILREPWAMGPTLVDLGKVQDAIEDFGKVRPVDSHYLINANPTNILAWLRKIQRNKTPFAFDIEGGCDTWSCCAISPIEPSMVPDVDCFHAFTIDWFHGNYTFDEKLAIYLLLKEVLEDITIPKILQNYLYDAFVLGYSYNIHLRGLVGDTMLETWELHPEFPKSLGFQTSIYTNEVFHKDEGREREDWPSFLRYCAKDTITTQLNHAAIESELSIPARAHLAFNHALLPAFLYMQLRGIRYDTEGQAKSVARNALEQTALQLQTNHLVGHEINVKSSPAMQAFLYKERGYAVRKNKKGRITADAETVAKFAIKFPTDLALKKILQLRVSRTEGQILSKVPDKKDARIRCAYNVVGTETGRITCYESNTGSGYNLQTVPKHLRKLFRADEGKLFFQCDLAGADAWTVAARCATLGDTTMLDDLKAGIKIAKVVVLLFKSGAGIGRVDRETLRELTKAVPSDALYHGSKCCQHGTNYMMGAPTMADTVFKQSKFQTVITVKECEGLRDAYRSRYWGIANWHRWIKEELIKKKGLTDAFGHFRRFWGSPYIDETIKQAASHEPQANTTGATNLALLRLYYDPDNRNPDGSFIIEPLHQVHDALCGQFPADRVEWAVGKIREYFNNEITIGNYKLVIPFEGGYGVSWGEQPNNFYP